MEDLFARQSESPGRRAAAYWFIDGLPEIVFGVAYLVWGSLGTFWGMYFPNLWMKTAVVLACIAFIALFFTQRRLLDYFKGRLTYPRTGYVRPPKDSPPYDLLNPNTPLPIDENTISFRLSTVFLFFLPMPIIGMLNTSGAIALTMGLVASFLYSWNRHEPHRYSVWAVAPIAVAGVVASTLELPPVSRQFVPLLIGGAWLLAHGGWTLLHYLHDHPKPRMLQSE